MVPTLSWKGKIGNVAAPNHLFGAVAISGLREWRDGRRIGALVKNL